jgi:alpha-ketoglutarate-dependent taurine dioxygenase
MSAHAYSEDQLVEQPTIDLARLNSRGWASLNVSWSCESDFRERLYAIATGIGVPVATRPGSNLCDTLVPTQSTNARARSLSKIHDVGEFPLHVDTAHWLTPCRYIVLACVQPGYGSPATLLMDTHQVRLNDSQTALLHSTPFRVSNGRKSFFSTILSKERPFVRFDQGCMTPTSPDGVKALDIYSRHNWSEYIEAVHWKTGAVVVIDNWRVLHGREASNSTDSDRKLLRISIL